MTEYNFVYLIVWGVALVSLMANASGQKYLFFMQTLILALFVAVRFETGYDWPVYENHFMQIASNDDFYLKFEFGYELLVYLFSKLGLGFYQFIAVLSLFEVFIIASSVRFFFPRHSMLVMAVLYSVPDFYLIPAFALVRQGLAVSLFFYGIRCFVENRKIMAWVFFLLAISFHYSVLGALLLWVFAFRFSIGRDGLAVFFIISAFLYLFSIDVARDLVEVAVTYFDPKYLIYLDRDVFNASFAYRFVYVMVSSFAFSCIYFAWRNKALTNTESALLNNKIYRLAALGVLIPLFLYGFPTISTRYQFFFSIFTVGICLSALDFFKFRDRLVVAAVVGALIYLPFYRFLTSPLSIVYIPYQSQFFYDKTNSTGQQRTDDLLYQLDVLWSK
jgi:hypothetical protein